MAEVWEAVDEILGRPVAVKILHPHLAADESFRERFRREAISAARLAHPNVVATFDTGTDAGITFIVMELVDSPPLRQALNDGGPMAPGGWFTSAPRWPTPSTTPTRRASCTATSSRPTS